MTPILRSIALSTQVTLPYVEQGDPAGVPVLLLHGVTDSWRSFELVLPRSFSPVNRSELMNPQSPG
jgi:pimeloyl-ACP methyl ester carboxylesterase